MVRFFKKYHKWFGLVFSFFIIMSAFSGIVLNHRRIVSNIDISRNLLPSSYRYNNWNNGAVKGSFKLSADSVLIYGGVGIWLTDTLHSHFSDYNRGLKSGVDNRIANKIIRTASGDVFVATTFDLYKLETDNSWENRTNTAGIHERIADLAVQGDSLIVMTRSQIFVSRSPYEVFTTMELCEPSDYSPKATLFRTFWLLHSGELFGLPGKIFVDLLGVFLIVLCITGFIYTFCPGIIKRKKKKEKPIKIAVGTMRSSIKWHNKVGAIFIIFFLVLVISGMFLRPPLMIVIIRSKVAPIPGSILNSNNPWHDKLRCLRYDTARNEWLLYASTGFYTLEKLNSTPEKTQKTPPISVMGVTVLEPTPSGWLVGSFSGLYFWNRDTGMIIDCFKGTTVQEGIPQGRPIFDNQVSGYSGDFYRKMILFKYDTGAEGFGMESFATMPDEIKNSRISLWHTCLEIHVGRAYRPLIGPFSDLYVFLFGLFVMFILMSGYVVYRKRCRKKQ